MLDELDGAGIIVTDWELVQKFCKEKYNLGVDEIWVKEKA